MRDFHNRERLFVHVSASSVVCTSFYRREGSEVEVSKLEALEAEALENTKQLQK